MLSDAIGLVPDAVVNVVTIAQSCRNICSLTPWSWQWPLRRLILA